MGQSGAALNRSHARVMSLRLRPRMFKTDTSEETSDRALETKRGALFLQIYPPPCRTHSSWSVRKALRELSVRN
eukprot:1505090-Pyramimonas_sp.AAC.1